MNFDYRFIIIFLILLNFFTYFYISKNSPVNVEKAKIINKLLRQSARWSVAADQDESPLINLLHANYGAGYLWALMEIASPEEIYQATNIDVFKHSKKISDIQDRATRKVTKACPQFVGDLDLKLLRLAGNA